MKDKGANEGEKVLVFPASVFCKWANKKSPSQYNTTYELSTFSCSKSLLPCWQYKITEEHVNIRPVYHYISAICYII